MTLPRVLFVTGTDTGVGKTVVTAALAVCLSREGAVAVLKPAQTGVEPDDRGDVDTVRALSGVTSVREGIRLREALAPTTAARRASVILPTVREHAATVRELACDHATVLVEGAGGLLVGIDGRGDGLPALAAELDLPYSFVVVVRAGLGTLNHSRLTVESLHDRGLPVLGLVIGAWPATPGLAEECNLEDLPATAGAPLVGCVPDGAGSLSQARFTAGAPTWFAPPIGCA